MHSNNAKYIYLSHPLVYNTHMACLFHSFSMLPLHSQCGLCFVLEVAPAGIQLTGVINPCANVQIKAPLAEKTMAIKFDLQCPFDDNCNTVNFYIPLFSHVATIKFCNCDSDNVMEGKHL